MHPNKVCPQCGSWCFPEELQGLCPQCLRRMLLQLDTEVAEPQLGKVGATLETLGGNKRMKTERSDPL